MLLVERELRDLLGGINDAETEARSNRDATMVRFPGGKEGLVIRSG